MLLTASGTDLLAVARTDSEAATLITSTIDHRDHGFILGVTNPALQPLNDLMVAAEQAGNSGDALQAIEDQWMARSGMKLYDEAVEEMIHAGVHVDKPGLIEQYRSAVKGKSNSEARAIAKGLTGVDIHWDWDSPRTREGYYRYKGGCGCAINRAIAYGPYADMIWMESKLPDHKQAEEFANGVHAVWPEQKFVYSIYYIHVPADQMPDSHTTFHPRSTGRQPCLRKNKSLTSIDWANLGTAGNSSHWQASIRLPSSRTSSREPLPKMACVLMASWCRSLRSRLRSML